MKGIQARIIFLVLAVMAVQSVSLNATGINDKDTVEVEKQNSALYLNAESDSKPREISLGLPTNKASAVPIFEDGLPVSYYIFNLFPYKSWHGGASAKSNGTMDPM